MENKTQKMKEEIKEVKEEINEVKQEIKKEEVKLEETEIKQDKKIEEKKIIKKELAVVRGENLPISTKHAMYLCTFIKGKKIEQAAEMLKRVLLKKMAVPMKGEVPHKRNMLGARYPINATKVFIDLLISLKANSQVNGLENPVITAGIANLASRPFRRFGSRRFKRTHVYLEAREQVNKPKEKK